jgi:ADP-heptose:LPS heptosyltransferase
LGDVIQALPVLRLLKKHLPASEIYWWIDAALAPLLEGDPDLTGLIRFERRRWAKPRYWPELVRSIHQTRQMHFDWVIDLQCLARSAAFAWLANGRRLIGLDEVREGARGFYDVAVRRASFHTHAVEWYLAVLPPLGVPVDRKFIWLPERPAVAAALASRWPAGGARWITLQPGARWDNKRWPVEYFAELVRCLVREIPDVRFAVLGSGADESLGQLITAAAPSHSLNLCGRTSLPEMIEWVRRGDLMVTNDTDGGGVWSNGTAPNRSLWPFGRHTADGPPLRTLPLSALHFLPATRMPPGHLTGPSADPGAPETSRFANQSERPVTT